MTRARGAKTASAILAGALIAIVAAGTAHAARVDRITVRQGQTFERTYGPLFAADPVFTPTPARCRTSDACDLIEIDYLHDTDLGQRLAIAVEWADPASIQTEVVEQGVLDLDVYLWDGDEMEVTHAASQDNPEKIGGDTGLADLPSDTYYLTIVNWAAVNVVYTVRGAASKEDTVVFDPPFVTGSAGGSATTSTLAPGSPEDTPADVASKPVVTPEVVAVPGTDGPLSAYAVGALSADSQADTPSASSLPRYVFTALLGAVGVAGAALVVVRIRRDMHTA